MAGDDVSIRDLRNHGGDVVDRAAAGERLVITRSGRPMAELGPLPDQPVPASVLVQRWGRLPPIDLDELRADVDAIIDPSL